jgi:hypothetical protein
VGLVRKLIGDKNSALVPVKGGYGAFGGGTMTVKARNKGEAKEAGRHIREFRDQQRREQFKTKVGFIHNHQKHFRDPLLQVRVFHRYFLLSLLLTFASVVMSVRRKMFSSTIFYYVQLRGKIINFRILRKLNKMIPSAGYYVGIDKKLISERA